MKLGKERIRLMNNEYINLFLYTNCTNTSEALAPTHISNEKVVRNCYQHPTTNKYLMIILCKMFSVLVNFTVVNCQSITCVTCTWQSIQFNSKLTCMGKEKFKCFRPFSGERSLVNQKGKQSISKSNNEGDKNKMIKTNKI
jgi:hypothetical protein